MSQAAIAAVERHHADELREEVQELRDLCNFYQQENEELTMVTGLYQRQIEEIKQKLETVPPPGGSAAGLRLCWVCPAKALHESCAWIQRMGLNVAVWGIPMSRLLGTHQCSRLHTLHTTAYN